jgi:alkylated DNA repair protein alkB family protein 4
MSSGVLVNLSLLGDCVMTYAPDKKDFDKKHNTPNRSRVRGAVDVFLPRRSLQIQSGSTRYDFSHAIRNENLLADRRVSVTFRESAAPATRTKVRGG